jgi:hypothetical protein
MNIKRLKTIPARSKRLYFNTFVLPGLVQHSQKWSTASFKDWLQVKENTLNYVARNQKPQVNVGAYSYTPGGPPLLYASCYAALTRSLFGDLDQLIITERQDWVAYIQANQSDDGLFRDEIIAGEKAESMDWWGFRHLTLHTLMALTALGGIAQHPLRLLEPFRRPGYMREWLAFRRWMEDPSSVSNEVQNYGTFLQYARDFQDEAWCQSALDEMYDWLDQTQDAKTGLWGSRFDTKKWLSYGIQTGYHIWLLYFYDGRPVKYLERIIDSCLATQNRLGGFGFLLNSSACEDIDTIDTLSRLYFISDYRRKDIRAALERAVPWILTNLNPDGGWVFRRHDPFWLHNMMFTKGNEASMFTSWFRPLSLAYLAKVLEDSPLAQIEWHFIDCPGHQFWGSRNKNKNEETI